LQDEANDHDGAVCNSRILGEVGTYFFASSTAPFVYFAFTSFSTQARFFDTAGAELPSSFEDLHNGTGAFRDPHFASEVMKLKKEARALPASASKGTVVSGVSELSHKQKSA
jgi:hypothetical protein